MTFLNNKLCGSEVVKQGHTPEKGMTKGTVVFSQLLFNSIYFTRQLAK